LPAATKKKPETRRPTFGAVVGGLVVMLLEIILPVILAVAIGWFLFSYFNLWQSRDRTVGLILFGVAVVIISVLLSAVIDGAAAPLRKSSRARGVQFTSSGQARFITIVLGGLILPITAVIAANVVPIPARGTLMQMISTTAMPTQPVKLGPAEEIGGIALNTTNPATKRLSIQTLQSFHSSDALAQLVTLATSDRAALNDPGVADMLAQAIASYGAEAKLPLFNAFHAIDPAQSTASAPASGDLYTRYFAADFDSLKAEITSGTQDAATRDAELARLQAAQAQLKDSLNNLEVSSPETGAGDARLDFILRTFLQMNLQQDGDLLAFARTTAMDARYASPVRGDALLLIGKLGGKDDLNVLYPYLKTGDSLIQARALQAITALQTKLNTPPQK
jgi:hypothetical protein